MRAGADPATTRSASFDALAPATGLGAVVYVVITAAWAGSADTAAEWSATGWHALTAALLAACWFALRSPRTATAVRRWSSVSITLVTLLIASNPIAYIVATEQAYPSTGMVLVIVAIGGLILDRRTAITAILVCNAAWLVCVAVYGLTIPTTTFWIELGMVNVVATVLAMTKARTVGRLDEARRQVAELAATDGLTGVANHRQIMVEGERRLHLTRRAGGELTVVFLDVDDLKAANDAHGHAAGDDIIRTVATVLSASVREGDLVGRIGGDEFVLVCEDLPDDQVESLQRRIYRALAHHGISASVGVASDDGTTGGRFEDLLGRADSAMYADKADRRS